MALDSFRQLILDAQAMMDPDFAGKLAADVTETDAGEGDAGFAFGAAAPTPEENEEVEDALEAAAEFNFGGNENQLTLLDPRSFNPFAQAPKRPFLKMPNQSTEPAQPKNGVPQVSILRPGMEAEQPTELDQNKEEFGRAFRSPRAPATP